MSEQGFAIFGTAAGACAIAWGANGVIGVQTFDTDVAKTRARIKRRFPAAIEQAPPPDIVRIISDITALLSGEARRFDYVALDDGNLPEFNRRVYAIARTIPPGQTLTYGEIATRLGDKLLARDVGAALGKNPFPIVVPCHRVLAASGKTGAIKTGGFSAPGGVATKVKLLSIERARPDGATPFDDLPLQIRGRR